MKIGSILLVEDNSHDEALALRALRKCDLADAVAVVRDGAEALDYLFCEGAHAGRDPLDRPQVVLLDLNLPKIDGHEVLRRIRADARTRRIPVVILSSSDEKGDVKLGYAHGANSFVQKPVDFAEYSNAVQQLSQYWLRLNKVSAEPD